MDWIDGQVKEEKPPKYNSMWDVENAATADWLGVASGTSAKTAACGPTEYYVERTREPSKERLCGICQLKDQWARCGRVTDDPASVT